MVARDPTSARILRCRECGEYLQCLECCLKGHAQTPLHTIQEWIGSYWKQTTLAELGLVYQLGHGGFPCPFPDLQKHDITVLDIPSLSTICVRYCGCSRSDAILPRQQLLRNGWYPATVTNPATCATFRTLRAFRLFNVLGNLTATDFIKAIQRYTDSMSFGGTSSLPQPARQFRRMARQWSMLSQVKRAGRGHDPAGVVATPLGGAAVICWACPYDGRNLPANWRDVDEKYKFLYMLIVAIDANFRMKNRFRKNEISDAPLLPGWAYWVDPEAYKRHITEHMSENDISTCIAFAALLQKNTRMTTGLRVSGVGACVCARHECVRPNGMGDLQKGERYCNIDFIFFSAVMSLIFLWLTVSYDIACQWKIRLAERMKTLPPAMRIDLQTHHLQFGLPVWHADAHEEDCRDEHSLNLQDGVGKTDGEAIERFWSGLNPASFSTKEMGLGHRADVLDDIIDNHNFLKNIGLGEALRRKLIIAKAERQRQVDAFLTVTDGVDPDTIKMWKKQIRDWKEDRSRPNPFQHSKNACLTEAQIRLRVQREERETNALGRADIPGSSCTAFIAAGIQIEDAQARIHVRKAVAAVLTAAQEVEVEELRLSLLRKLARFRQLQSIYMPAAAVATAQADLSRDANSLAPDPEKIDLFMPSAMKLPAGTTASSDVHVIQSNPALSGVEVIEENLRVAQCENSLATLRSILNSKRWLIAYRNAHLVGQRQTTKAASTIAGLTERAGWVKHRYRRGFDALERLGVLRKYHHLRKLTDDDVTLAGEADATDLDARNRLAAAGAGGRREPRIAPNTNGRNRQRSRQVMSWIWTARADANDGHLDESIRVEWTPTDPPAAASSSSSTVSSLTTSSDSSSSAAAEEVRAHLTRDSPTPGDGSESSNSTLRNTSTPGSSSPSVTQAAFGGADDSISGALRARDANPPRPIFRGVGRITELYMDESLFQACDRFHGRYAPLIHADPLVVHGYSPSEVLEGMSDEQVDTLRDILRRFHEAHLTLHWDDLSDGIRKVHQTPSRDIVLEPRGYNGQQDEMLGIPIVDLEYIAHVVVAAQQILLGLTTLTGRSAQSSFVVDVNYQFLRMLEAHPDAPSIYAALEVVKARLLRSEKHILRQLRATRIVLTGGDEESISSVNSTLPEVRELYGTVSAEQEVWTMAARKDYRLLPFGGDIQLVQQGIRSVLDGTKDFNDNPYRPRSGKPGPPAEEYVPTTPRPAPPLRSSLRAATVPPSAQASPSWAPSASAIRAVPGGPIPDVLSARSSHPHPPGILPAASLPRKVPDVLAALRYGSGGPSMTGPNTNTNTANLRSDVPTTQYQLGRDGLDPVGQEGRAPPGYGGAPPGGGNGSSGGGPPFEYGVGRPRYGGPPGRPNGPAGGDPAGDPNDAGGQNDGARRGRNDDWQLNYKLPLSELPSWDGDDLTAIDYLVEADELAQSSDWLFVQVGNMAPRKFEGKVKTWWLSLPRFVRLQYARDWPHLFNALASQFLTAEWRRDRLLEAEKIRFRQEGHRTEDPLDYFQRLNKYNAFLYPLLNDSWEEQQLAVTRLLEKQPFSWSSILNPETCPTVAALLARAKSQQRALLSLWGMDTRSQAASTPRQTFFRKAANVASTPEEHEEGPETARSPEASAFAVRAKNEETYPQGEVYKGYHFKRDDSSQPLL
ncbi:TY3B-TY3B protein [Mycena chlorophos]|uniref:TY3B-TY3B protein n=1 Tax=Mycena chlorophos TaxID=658473 RepID=A0A8H6W063_MYCCL|nr:TY3B-TY3B protein [Mycena chlorophos]